MRLLYQCGGFLLSTIGGAEVLSYHLLKELSRRGHNVLVVASRANSDPLGRQAFDGLDLVRLDFDAAIARRGLPEMREIGAALTDLMTGFAPDVLHLNDAGLNSLFFLRGGITGHLPRVLTFHSAIRTAGKDGLQARLAADANRVVTVSQAHYGAAAATMPTVQGKMLVITNALPSPDLQPADLPFAPPALLCIGRLLQDKGIDLAIRAFARLHERGVAARLTIAGDGPERSSLETLARELAIASYVEFTGWVMPDRVASLINATTIVLMPSRWPEPFGLVALQAAHMGRPTIAAAVGGLPEVVEHGSTGLLVAPDDEPALADAIQTLLVDGPMARRLGQNARKRAQSTFDFGAMVDAYERVYAEARSAPAQWAASRPQGRVNA